MNNTTKVGKDKGDWADRLFVWLSIPSGYVGGIGVLVLAFMVTYHVACRYFFDKPSIWVLPLGGFMVVFIFYMSLCYGQKTGAHVAVDLLTSRLPARVRRVLEVIATIIVVPYIAIIIWQGYGLVIRAYRAKEATSDALQAPMWIPETLVVIGSVAFLLILLLTVRSQINGKWFVEQRIE